MSGWRAGDDDLMAVPSTPEPGTPVHVAMAKWGDRPHWEFDGVLLGSDEHGDWIGVPAGTHHHRPGAEFDSVTDTVTLVPVAGWHAATFQAVGSWCAVYVDMTTPPVWDGTVLRAVDLDLDVVRLADPFPPAVAAQAAALGRSPGEVYVDDEDEFEEHRVAYGYPDDVVAATRASCDEVLAAVRERRAPYDGTHLRWLDALSRRSAPPAS